MPKCRATAKSTGQQCTRNAIAGAPVCGVHGGRAQQVRAKAAQRTAEVAARQVLGRLGYQPITDPLTALSDLAGEVVAWKSLCADHVAELERLRYSTEAGEQIRGEILLFERALDRCASVLAAIARLNIDERLVKIEEGKAAVLLSALDAGLAAAGVSGPALVEAKVAAAAVLRVASERLDDRMVEAS